ncbi:MAG TPA: MOSC domain-containing protein [Paracoccaceae bacterium]|nr:MOSC domain-containing protein [Paracoccaceae bacterium]
MKIFTVSEIRTGKVKPLGPKAVPSGIDKHPVSGPIRAETDGLTGDEQGDRRHHGGPDKAIHAYPTAHYADWAADLPDRAGLFRPGGFGENFVIPDVTEADICLGDLWRYGDVLLEVSQGRQPCWRLNLRFERPDIAWLVQKTGRTGWYFRVLEPGDIRPGGQARLEARPHADWPLDRVSNLLYRDRMDMEALAELAALPGLPESWQRLAERRIASGQTEDWSRRIKTPD